MAVGLGSENLFYHKKSPLSGVEAGFIELLTEELGVRFVVVIRAVITADRLGTAELERAPHEVFVA